MKKVICIGSATKDIFLPLEQVNIIDNPGDLTQKKLMAFEYGAKIYAENLIEELGGSAVNVAMGLAKSEYKPFVLARTSKSEIGKWIIKQVGKHGIKKNYMQQNGGVESEVSVIIVDKKTIEHVILRTGDSINQFDIVKALEKYHEKVDWIYVGSQKQNWQEKLDLILDFAKRKKAKIALNPSGYQISNDAKQLASYFSQLELVFINRDEAIEIVKNIEGQVEDKIDYLAEKLLSYGLKTVIITDGENGAYVGNQEKIYFLEPSIEKKVDSVGAGDAFCSGFMASYIENQDIKNSLAWGMVNSGSVVAQIGGQKGLLNKKELKQKAELLVLKIKEQ